MLVELVETSDDFWRVTSTGSVTGLIITSLCTPASGGHYAAISLFFSSVNIFRISFNLLFSMRAKKAILRIDHRLITTYKVTP